MDEPIDDKRSYYVGPDGIPVGAIEVDILLERATKVAGLLAITSQTPSEVSEVLDNEVLSAGYPPHVLLGFTVLVLQELSVEFFGPMLTVLQVEHLDTDFVAQLRARAHLDDDPRRNHGGKSPEQDTP